MSDGRGAPPVPPRSWSCERDRGLRIDPTAGLALSGRMKVRDVVERPEADGWQLVRTRGQPSAVQALCETRSLVTVPGRDDLAPGTLASIWKPAGLRP